MLIIISCPSYRSSMVLSSRLPLWVLVAEEGKCPRECADCVSWCGYAAVCDPCHRRCGLPF
ncbi:hypothetical protein [Xenorhabdus entomophaga]|uniref:hypothetical protein n=1 Tax=Xenorhabdus entomophaga TaxID=3136257 RepID=UPI0030F47E32